MSTLGFGLRTDLPKVSHSTALDIYIMWLPYSPSHSHPFSLSVLVSALYSLQWSNMQWSIMLTSSTSKRKCTNWRDWRVIKQWVREGRERDSQSVPLDWFDENVYCINNGSTKGNNSNWRSQIKSQTEETVVSKNIQKRKGWDDFWLVELHLYYSQ